MSHGHADFRIKRYHFTNKLERVGIGNYPTPLEEMPALAKDLGGPKLFVKREDMTGLAMGGNKTRQLDYIFADARKKGANAVIATCGIQSNWSRQVVAAAVKLGMKPSLVLRTAQFKEPPKILEGNTLLDHIMGAGVRFVRMGIDEDPQVYLEEEAENLRKKGYTPYILGIKESNSPLATAAYADCMVELEKQTKQMHLDLDVLVVACGGGPTQAGLALGAKILGLETKVIGVNVGAYTTERARRVIRETSRGAAKLLGVSTELLERDITIKDGYAGKGYGIPTKESNEALLRVARKEGLILDPVYTAKAMAGLIDMASKSELDRDEEVCFVHTGGIPALFAYGKFFQPD